MRKPVKEPRPRHRGWRRFDKQVRCECGDPATRQVQFVQLSSSGEAFVNYLVICQACYELMQAEDSQFVLIK